MSDISKGNRYRLDTDTNIFLKSIKVLDANYFEKLRIQKGKNNIYSYHPEEPELTCAHK